MRGVKETNAREKFLKSIKKPWTVAHNVRMVIEDRVLYADGLSPENTRKQVEKSVSVAKGRPTKVSLGSIVKAKCNINKFGVRGIHIRGERGGRNGEYRYYNIATPQAAEDQEAEYQNTIDLKRMMRNNLQRHISEEKIRARLTKVAAKVPQ